MVKQNYLYIDFFLPQNQQNIRYNYLYLLKMKEYGYNLLYIPY